MSFFEKREAKRKPPIWRVPLGSSNYGDCQSSHVLKNMFLVSPLGFQDISITTGLFFVFSSGHSCAWRKVGWDFLFSLINPPGDRRSKHHKKPGFASAVAGVPSLVDGGPKHAMHQAGGRLAETRHRLARRSGASKSSLTGFCTLRLNFSLWKFDGEYGCGSFLRIRIPPMDSVFLSGEFLADKSRGEPQPKTSPPPPYASRLRRCARS